MCAQKEARISIKVRSLIKFLLRKESHLRFLVIRFIYFVVRYAIRVPLARQVIAGWLAVVLGHRHLQQILLEILIVAIGDFAVASASGPVTLRLCWHCVTIVDGRRRRRRFGRLTIVVILQFFLLLLVAKLAQRNFPLHI